LQIISLFCESLGLFPATSEIQIQRKRFNAGCQLPSESFAGKTSARIPLQPKAIIEPNEAQAV
jgi:hypothetical protein